MKLRKYILIISICLVIIGISIKVNSSYKDYVIEKKEKNSITNFLEHQDNFSDYIALLEIPKISFKRGIKKGITVDEDITILNYNYIPDGNVIIAGHSGHCSVCHFNDLDKLELNDLVYFYYDNTIYIYEIKNIEEKKKYTFDIENDLNTITLITCKNNSDYLQIIIAGKLIGKESY